MQYPLTVSNLKKTFKVKGDVVQALRGISFKVKKGEIFGLLGPNGEGKTTTINILTGILTPDSGSIRFFGKKPCEETQERINAATAYNSLCGDLTVRQNMKVYARMYNVQQPAAKIDELLEKMGILEIQHRRVRDLSTGQKTRVNLAKALINSPDLLFLDEATSGLDPDISQHIRHFIKNLDTTIIFTSHIMSEVEELCDRVAFLSEGKILKIDTPKGIKKLIPQNLVVIKFLSQPANAEEILKTFEIQFQSKQKIIIKVKNPKETHLIIHTLITNGFQIRDFHLKRPTLDEVFIKVARGEI